MNEYLEKAIPIADTEIRPDFERIWENVTNQDIPTYRILIWGSTIQDKDRTPNDLDVIIEYTETSISPAQENSIESWLKSTLTIDHFKHVDPVVAHHTETPTIIANSRCSKVYSVDENGWLRF